MPELDDVIRRIQKVHDAYAPERKAGDDDEAAKKDEFTKKKKEISQKIKACREVRRSFLLLFLWFPRFYRLTYHLAFSPAGAGAAAARAAHRRHLVAIHGTTST